MVLKKTYITAQKSCWSGPRRVCLRTCSPESWPLAKRGKAVRNRIVFDMAVPQGTKSEVAVREASRTLPVGPQVSFLSGGLPVSTRDRTRNPCSS